MARPGLAASGRSRFVGRLQDHPLPAGLIQPTVWESVRPVLNPASLFFESVFLSQPAQKVLFSFVSTTPPDNLPF